MEEGKIILITGGTRSGKSEFAELYTAYFKKPVVYIATATVHDAEMEMRVKLHKERRPSSWTTVEEPTQVSRIVREYGDSRKVILLDCMTFLITNLMFLKELPEDEERFKKLEEQILQEIKEIVEAAREQNANLIIVSNESGLGLIPPDRLSRKYQELVGRANQVVAREANEVYLVAAGLPVEIKKDAQKILEMIRGED